MDDKYLQRLVNRRLDEINAAMVLMGASNSDITDIKEIKIGELLTMMIRNGTDLHVIFKDKDRSSYIDTNDKV